MPRDQLFLNFIFYCFIFYYDCCIEMCSTSKNERKCCRDNVCDATLYMINICTTSGQLSRSAGLSDVAVLVAQL